MMRICKLAIAIGLAACVPMQNTSTGGHLPVPAPASRGAAGPETCEEKVAALAPHLPFCDARRAPRDGLLPAGNCHSPGVAYTCKESTTYFLDTPAGLTAPGVEFAHDLETRLAADLNGLDARAFRLASAPGSSDCGTPGGTDGPPQARITPLFGSAPAEIRRRFWRVEFTKPGADTRFAVEGCWQPAMVELLRHAANAVAPASHLKVGREQCIVAPSTAQSENAADPALLSWPYQRIGAGEMAGWPGAGVPLPVTLLDTACDTSERSQHGCALAQAIARSLRFGAGGTFDLAAPFGVSVVNVFGGGETATTVTSVARGLYTRLTQSPPAPQVINLSLGYPAELNLRRPMVTCPGFNTSTAGVPPSVPPPVSTEDGIGESLRYLLEVVAPKHPEALIVIASGNRPARQDDVDAYFGGRRDLARALNPNEPLLDTPYTALLQPAEGVRRAPQANVLVVGPTRMDDQPSSIAVPDWTAEPALVAPGEQIYLPAPGSETAPQDICLPTSDRPISADRAAFTGSSLSAALTSGVAGRLMAALLAKSVEFQGADVARLLLAASVAVRRDGPKLQPDRVGRLALPQLSRALTCLTPQNAHDVFLRLASQGPARPALAASLNGWLATCERRPVGPDLGQIPAPASDAAPSDLWLREAVGRVAAACTPLAAPAPFVFVTRAGTLGVEANPSPVPDLTLGSVGPQPLEPGCPDCGFVRSVTQPLASQGGINVAISTSLPTTTTLTKPVLLVTVPMGATTDTALGPKTFEAKLYSGGTATVAGQTTTISDATDFKAGYTFKMTGIDLSTLILKQTNPFPFDKCQYALRFERRDTSTSLPSIDTSAVAYIKVP